ncbi:hypothetical protein M2321_003934 [Rhodoblastus acidophilus]|nr:helix-turn-helix domain-containing protein [Rhodoblastus acidophilus]MCW2276329.1 hypothetical protein [Rhodoblastus acidophilus]
MNQLLSLQEAASHLRMCERSLRACVDAGELAYIDLARPQAKRRRMRFDPADLAAFAAERRRKTCPSSNGRTPPISGTNSGFNVYDFAALREKWDAEKPKSKNAPEKAKRRGK